GVSAGRNQAAAYNPTIYWSGSITASHLWYKTEVKAYGIGLDLIKFGGAPLASKNFQDIDEH
ncbi:MAG TPA: deacylase, partial [Marinilabiliaceae bacterium]|nr:deacylase [Marinilabiliaceae bacterium]